MGALLLVAVCERCSSSHLLVCPFRSSQALFTRPSCAGFPRWVIEPWIYSLPKRARQMQRRSPNSGALGSKCNFAHSDEARSSQRSLLHARRGRGPFSARSFGLWTPRACRSRRRHQVRLRTRVLRPCNSPVSSDLSAAITCPSLSLNFLSAGQISFVLPCLSDLLVLSFRCLSLVHLCRPV